MTKLEWQRRDRAANPEKYRTYYRNHRAADPEKYRQRKRAESSAWRDSNREKLRAGYKAHYYAHRETRLAQGAAYRASHPDVIKERKKAYYMTHRDAIIERVGEWSRRKWQRAGKGVLMARVGDWCSFFDGLTSDAERCIAAHVLMVFANVDAATWTVLVDRSFDYNYIAPHFDIEEVA